MKQIAKILVLITLMINQSCNNDNNSPCEDMFCFSDPNSFQFELVDKATGENLFTNGTYNPNEIQIINISDNSKIEYSFIDENNYNIISIHSIGWKTEIVECSLKINDIEILRLYVDAKRLNENCCSFTRYEEIRIENVEYQYNIQSEIYKILID